ncbi:MAG TPA: diguanylate cyclase [Zoogloea sp.]|uniref:diguanylate cyclase domain-containing protein n=1 Tax=Zoogloea sp. TaxID=49181 RepID=UPI002CBAAA62|nr:diguanylate cyclase [Zoogloea sp.]HMV63291.1 diguanylate cyclase [Rhodocyclaceae bacterium]HMW51368.1 diguanylate cyclase [Rhodocyclaceae bacterium]HMZ75829.1 diguanylate cyclase [Rhodocyclaceae bacterium]HNA66207.1 diguanylate cyclase [Rhodocyclaceae bacterium]HNB63995.1 diguanylate cyclase [Rhodocyclaceae bacterium]
MTAAQRLRELLLPLVAGFGALALTLVLWQHEQQANQAAMAAHFDASVRQTAARIDQRIAVYTQMLRGVQGFFRASDLVNREDFATYVDALAQGPEFAGLQSLVYSRAVPGPDGLHAPMIYAAPDLTGNQRAVGHDQMIDAARRAALLHARDSGTLAISQRLRLHSDTQDGPESAFILYLALYRHDRPLNTQAERRDALTGWVQAAFRMKDLMSSLAGETPPGLDVQLYDGIEPRPDALLYDSRGGQDAAAPVRFEGREFVAAAGHDWCLVVRSQPEFERRFGSKAAEIVLIAGISLSALIAALIWQLITCQTRAHAQARSMTQELRENAEVMRLMAQHDPLTLLPNRALFSDRLQSVLARARRDTTRAALMFVDLDRFKPVNDAYGHAVGDDLLREVSRRMKLCLRESDTLARLGGDEFVVLLAPVDAADDARIVAQRILQTVEEPFYIADHRLSVSASIGIALYPDQGVDDLALMKAADDAMYVAKDRGRGRMVFAGDPAPA